jgi:integrase/recombinase XerD
VRLGDARALYVRWLQATRGLSQHTIRAYDGDVAALARHVGADADVATIDSRRLLAFIEAERAAGLSARSLRRRVSGLRGFFGWLVSSGHVSADPWIGLRIDLGRPRRLPRVVPRDELDRLLDVLRDAARVSESRIPNRTLDEPHHATTLLAVVIMVVAGLRVSEVASVCSRDIDLGGRTVRVLGKGLRERNVFLPNDWVASLLSAYLTTRETLGIEHDRLLFNRRGTPLAASTIRARLLKVAHDSGLQTRVTPHILRHTAATQLIEAGVDIRYIQRLLGHASLTTTEIYTHVSDQSLQQVVCAADVLGRSFAR